MRPAAAGADGPLLECREVSKHFGALAAVDGISFAMRPGEILGVAGPNGAGKTTLFDVISGLQPISGGHIRFAGREIGGAEPEDICHLGLTRTFQLNAAFETMTVQENIEVAAYFGARRRQIPGLGRGRDTRRRARDALSLVGLEDKRFQPAATLPVVDRKLLMIGSAMACEPKLILLDEPIGGLNAEETATVKALLVRIRDRGVSLIVIEHVMHFLMTLADRLLVMHHGAQLFEGSAAELLADDRVVRLYLGRQAAERLRSEGLGAGAAGAGEAAP